MGFFERFKKPREAPEKRGAFCFTDSSYFDDICVSGYTPLDKRPEIVAGVNRIAEVISSMTIYLMANTDKGDKRIINELSRALDINPCSYMTRRTWMSAIVNNLLLHGSGNAVVLPHTDNGLLGDMEVISPDRVTFEAKQGGYDILINGVRFDSGDLLHFVHNPDKTYPWKGTGYRVVLREIAQNLAQASATEKGFMSSKWKPSIIVKVDAMTEEFSGKAGRKKLLESYVESGEAGEPWLIPAEQFDVQQVKPLTLGDLAIADVITIDKKTVASILGVPAFILGVGEFNQNEWNMFVNTTIKAICKEIEQELTKKLILSPKWYIKFNLASLYSFDLKTLQTVYSELYVRGIVDGNEVRDRIGMEPRDGLDELVILENYIPLGKIGEQLKLTQEGSE